uniref:Uncharacterized protein n=1 Tax=Arundo donax TaxID=35708 RepID=A0A0A8Z9K7_ARUDO
MPHCHRRC